jgi:hypothetical protein
MTHRNKKETHLDPRKHRTHHPADLQKDEEGRQKVAAEEGGSCCYG